MTEGPPVTVDSLVADLRTLGLAEGDAVVMRCATRAIAPTAKGMASVLLDALLETVGPRGTVVGPTHAALQKASDSTKTRDELVGNYRETFANPFKAAESGYIDALIYPEDTRPTLIRSLEMLKNKQDHNPPKKHGNIPL